MENIQRDLAKEIAALQSPKPTRKRERWTLLFVGDHGRVVAFRWFSWMITVWASLLVLAAIGSGLLYYRYLHTRNVHVRLERSLDNVQQQAAGLRSDKEVLMTRLVVAETELKNLRARLDPRQVVKTAGDRQEDHGTKVTGSNSPVGRQTQIAVQAPEAKLTLAAPADDPVSPEKGQKVSIEEFNVFHESADNTFRAQFVLRNNGADSDQVSGRTAVILKKLNTQPDKWLTLPTLKLDAGVPTGSRKGQYFSIARFKAVSFMVKSKMDPRQFDAAKVYVFDTDGNLLLEQDFSLNIQEAVSPSNQ